MKRTIFFFIAFLSLCLSAQEMNQHTITDTLDTIVQKDYQGMPPQQVDTHPTTPKNRSEILITDENTKDTIIALAGIFFLLGMPTILVIIFFLFRYKNQKAKYRLAEQILNAGQPIPNNLFANELTNNLLHRGIGNICIGIGLFIFLWAVTRVFGIGCIGLLVMFTGFGQVIIYYLQHPHKNTDYTIEVKKKDESFE